MLGTRDSRSRWVAFLGAAALLAGLTTALGCTDTSGFDEGGDGGVTDAGADAGSGPCTENAAQCVGQSYQVCVGGKWRQKWACSKEQVCVPTLGCAECDPTFGSGCKGNDVYRCNQNGQFGALEKSCLGLTCEAGKCRAPNCAVGSRLIYVVDRTNRLLSFDPAKEKDHFTLIATLGCPAGTPFPGRNNPATPFSMSVDRGARAWILYTSGEIFWVSTKDGTCQKSPFVPSQQGFKLFGMGFVADAKGSSAEKLFVSNSRYDASSSDRLGYIDPATMKITTVGQMTKGQQSAELTGTGNAELYAYNPGTTSSTVARVDKSSGKAEKTWSVTSLGNQVSAWAFAHYGGKFYIFVTTQSLLNEKSYVLRFNPADGQTVTFLADIPYAIVGAGVSTCAPVIE